MRKVILRMNEQHKYQVIKSLINNKGNKNAAAIKLGLTRRQIDRLIVKYKEKGKNSFIHGNHSKKPVNKISSSLSNNIILLYKNKYYDCNFKHFNELLEERENIHVSYNTVYNLLTSIDIYSPRIRKATRKKIRRRKILANKNYKDKNDKEIEMMVNHQIAIEDSHPRQEKPKYFGEVIEMDGSIHSWFGNTRTCLHLAIDLCTGAIVGATFQTQETLKGYYTILKQILENHGIPVLFKTDRRTIFTYESLSKEKRTDEKDVLTQFGYACQILGTSIETTSVSQAKGTVERANGTLQGRLIQELRLAGANTITTANEYLIKTFIPAFNKRFALDYTKMPNAFEMSPDENKINYTLAVLSTRKIDNGNSIRFINKYYQPYDSLFKLITFKPHTECLVIEAFDGSLLASIDNHVYQLVEVKKHKEFSAELDNIFIKKTESKPRYIPPMTHPWKLASFKKQRENAHVNHVYA